MPRRGHKKSRAGCAECKRRHVKCDETHPSCVNCKVASLKCSYTRSSTASQTLPGSASATPAYSPLTPDIGHSTTTGQDVPSISTSPSYPLADTVNMDHLELLHHFESVTSQSFSKGTMLAQNYRNTAVSNALRFHFLMYAILALSALHLCRLRPDRLDHYYSLATSLQAVGLSELSDTILNVNTENCVALFLFTSMTGMHSFSDTFCFQTHEFNHFLDKLTSSIRLMRGVRQVMDNRWWDYLRGTELAGMLAQGQVLGGPEVERDKETQPLWQMLEVSDLGAGSVSTYEETIVTLQRVFNGEAQLKDAEDSVTMVFAWPVMLSAEYNELLIQRRPEALVILAYYGIILHGRRKAWAVGDGGRYLIDAISNYLGRHWDHWLTLPKSVISQSPTATASNTPSSKVS